MRLRSISVRLNQQQLQLLHQAVSRGTVSNVDEMFRRALRDLALPRNVASVAPANNGLSGAQAPSAHREIIYEHTLEPGTGKAFEVRSGHILRVEQIVGPQCVDFNCFNLYDYKEPMHVGRMRAMYGLLPTEGDFIWSAPPRERAMMYILKDTARRNDIMFSRCNAYLYESAYGLETHTNCHDIQAEAQREYGLTPDDVHDSFNMFMCTEVIEGRPQIKRQHTGRGDHIELLAMIDVLAIPNVCGNDVGRTSNFSLKPVKISILRATGEDLQKVPKLTAYKSQRTPESFRQPIIKRDRVLTRNPDFVAEFCNVPLQHTAIDVALDAREIELLHAANLHEFYGDDEGEMLRDVLLSWWEQNFTNNLPGTSL
jgi:uncharacterized protein